MDYLINEGYPSAAQKFAKEANIQQSAPGGAIQARVDIRNAIHAGEIQQAIEKINELDKQVASSRFHCLPASLQRLYVFHAPLIYLRVLMRNNSHFSPQYEQFT